MSNSVHAFRHRRSASALCAASSGVPRSEEAHESMLDAVVALSTRGVPPPPPLYREPPLITDFTTTWRAAAQTLPSEPVWTLRVAGKIELLQLQMGEILLVAHELGIFFGNC